MNEHENNGTAVAHAMVAHRELLHSFAQSVLARHGPTNKLFPSTAHAARLRAEWCAARKRGAMSPSQFTHRMTTLQRQERFRESFLAGAAVDLLFAVDAVLEVELPWDFAMALVEQALAGREDKAITEQPRRA